MGSYAALQVFAPPGITSDAATPNFLRDLSNDVFQVQWSDVTQGGLASAQFDCHKLYGDTVDVLFKNVVLWGLFGAVLSAAASPNDGHVTATGLLNESYPQGETFEDLQAGDVVMLTDGVNTELFSVASISGSSPTWTIALNAPGTSLLGLGGTLLNSYGPGAIIVRLQFQGYVSQRPHSTAFDNQFSVNATGFFNRYMQVLESFSTLNADGGSWLYNTLLKTAGGAKLGTNSGPGGPNWPAGTTTVLCSDLASLLIGEKVDFGIEEGNKEGPFTISAISVANGTFTFSPATSKAHNVGEVVSPAGVTDGLGMHDLVIPQGTMAHPNNTSINLQTSSQSLAESIAAVVRQETGSAKTSTWACWADVLRQVHHEKIDSVPPNMGQTKMASDAPAGSSTFTVANLGRIKTGRRVFITGVNGCDSLKVQSIDKTHSRFTTVGTSSFDHPAGDKVVCIYDVTPGFLLNGYQDNGSGVGDTVGKIQTTDEDGTQLINAAICTGTVMSQDGTVQSTLAAQVNPGATSLQSVDDLFSDGDTVTLVAKGGVNTEQVTLTSDATGTGPYTYGCTPIVNEHDAGRPIVLASGAAAGPTIIVFESDSIDEYDYFEGQITSNDIIDKATLVAWAKQQIEITAWPAINAAIDLDMASCRIDGRTLLGITGFPDGVPLYLNATQVQYQWLAATRSCTGSIQAGLLKGTAKFEQKERAKEYAIRDKYRDPQKQPHGMQGHIAGGEILPNADNTFSLNPVTVKHGGAVYQLAAVTNQVAPEGVSMWGVDLSNPTAPALSLLPSVVFNGRAVYAEAIYEATDDDGVAATLVAQFTGVPLWRVEVRGGVIFGVAPLFATNGIALSNMPSVTAAAPAVSFATPSAILLASGDSCDITLNVSFSNLPIDDATHEIKYHLRTNGTTAWSHKFTRKIGDLPLPGASILSDAPVFHNEPAGIVIDIGASFASTNGESAITPLVTGFALPAISGGSSSTCAETHVAVSAGAAVQLLAANAARLGVIITNRANSPLYVGTDNTTSPTIFTDEFAPGESRPLAIPYTGALWGQWAAPDATAGAQANIAEFT